MASEIELLILVLTILDVFVTGLVITYLPHINYFISLININLEPTPIKTADNHQAALWSENIITTPNKINNIAIKFFFIFILTF